MREWPSQCVCVCVSVRTYFVVPMVVTLSCHGYRFGSVRGKSRLIREDENDRSDEDADDEEGSRVRTFGGKAQPAKQMQVSRLQLLCELTSRNPKICWQWLENG